jgi:hypothetical protein
MDKAEYLTNAEGGCCFCDDPCEGKRGHFLAGEYMGEPVLALACPKCFQEAMEESDG